MEAIEHAYQAWLPDRSEQTVLVDKLEFDFRRMELTKQKDRVLFCTFVVINSSL